jgi:hypothetical protein
MRNTSITQLIIGTAVAVGMSVIAISAVAQSPVEATQEALTNRFTSPSSETEFRLSDHQQLKGYFLDGRFRWVSAIPTMWNACAGRLSERFGWHEASTTSGRLMH